MKRIYLTGGSGFIGGHLVSRLGVAAEAISHDDIFSHHFEDCGNFYYLASYGNMANQTNVAEVLRANVSMVGRVISGVCNGEFKCGHFTYISSSSVLLDFQTPYSRTKRAAEEIVQAVTEIKSCIVRPYSVFGRNEQPSHLIPTLIRSCLEGEEVNFAPGPMHDWVAVEDVVDGLIVLSNCGATGIFELGTGIGRTNEEVLGSIERITGKKANINTVGTIRPYDNRSWWCRDSKAHKLGWSAKRSFEETLESVIEDYKNSPAKYANPKLQIV